MLKEPGLLKNGMFLGLAENQFCFVLVKSQVGLQWDSERLNPFGVTL